MARKGIARRQIPEPLANWLIDRGLVRENRTIDPVLRQVILTAVRGEGYGLFVVTPFTDPVDRAVADLLMSRAKLEELLPREELADLFPASLGGLGPWSSRFRKGNGGEPGVLPPSPN